jgi:hypothetical protein
LPEDGRIENEGILVSHGVPLPEVSADCLGHEDIVAGNLDGYFRGERGSASLTVAKVPIKGRKRGAGADDPEIDRNAAGLAEITLRSIHHFAAQACFLAGRVHAKQSQIAAVAAKFDVDAGYQAGGVFGDEEFAFCHIGANAFDVNTITFDEGLLDAESGIDQTNERFGIGGKGGTNLKTLKRTAMGGVRHR